MKSKNTLTKMLAALTLLSMSAIALVNAQSTVDGSMNTSGQNTTIPSFFNFTPPTPPTAPTPFHFPGTTPMPNPGTSNPGYQYPTTPQTPQYPGGGNQGGYPGGYPDGYPGGSTTTARIYIIKYVNGMRATASSSLNTAFSLQTMTSANATNTATSTGTLTLGPSGASPYQTYTDVNKGMNFTLSEMMNANTGIMCMASSSSSTTPFALAGYSVGNSMGEAVTATKSTTAPSFTNLQSDKYVIVWNTYCGGGNNGTIGGDVTGGATTSTSTIGVLKVTGVSTQQGTAVADGTFANGWKFLFNITVPTNEPNLYMKFADWMNSINASSTIPIAGNMRISSAQAATSTPVVLNAANTYSTTPLVISGDMDTNTPGLQVQVLVETAVPVNSMNGSYTTTYSVKTQ